MQIVQIELEESILFEVDATAENLHTNRNNFIETAIRKAVYEAKLKLSEKGIARQYAEAYGKLPVQPDEFYVDEDQLIEAWKDL